MAWTRSLMEPKLRLSGGMRRELKFGRSRKVIGFDKTIALNILGIKNLMLYGDQTIYTLGLYRFTGVVTPLC